MILASRSGDSSSSKRMPLTVPAVPTGINTGVSIWPRRVVNTPARASPFWASISNLFAGTFVTQNSLPHSAKGALHKKPRAHRWQEYFLAQRRKGAKRCRVFGGFLCAFAPLREKYPRQETLLCKAALRRKSKRDYSLC